MTLDEYIKTYRYADGSRMSYAAFAELVPCSLSYPWMIARGRARPHYRMACRIEQITDGLVPRTNWFPSEDTPINQDVPNVSELVKK